MYIQANHSCTSLVPDVFCQFTVNYKVCLCVFVQVVQKKEAHDYRCLFRVCFMPKNLHMMLQEDPTAFMYLYLQVDCELVSACCKVH